MRYAVVAIRPYSRLGNKVFLDANINDKQILIKLGIDVLKEVMSVLINM